MPDRNKRKKASELFSESAHIFEPVPFKEAFPSIDDLKIEAEFEGNSIKDWDRNVVYTMKNPPGEFIDCKNSFCFGGGFHISDTLRQMVSIKQTERAESFFCKGKESSSKGKRIYRSCTYVLKVNITISYKSV